MGDDAGTGADTGPREGACTGGTVIIGACDGALDGKAGICVGALDDGAAVGGTDRTGGTADGNVGVGTGGFDGAVAGARAACCCCRDDIATPRRYHRSWNTAGMGMWTATIGNIKHKLTICFNCIRSFK
jgi:hypothetical protein